MEFTNNEYQKELRRFNSIPIPKWKRFVMKYVMKRIFNILNLNYQLELPNKYLNLKGETYDLIDGIMVKKSNS